MSSSVILGKDITTKQSVLLSAKARRSSVYILGLSGYGKSSLLENMAYQDAVAQEGYCFIDPHGSSADTLLSSFTALSTNRQEDIIFWDPSDIERPFGLNPFTCDPRNKIEMSLRAQNFVLALENLAEFSEVFANATRMKDLLLSVGHAFTAHQGHSLP